jgi:hypothetical protein
MSLPDLKPEQLLSAACRSGRCPSGIPERGAADGGVRGVRAGPDRPDPRYGGLLFRTAERPPGLSNGRGRAARTPESRRGTVGESAGKPAGSRLGAVWEVVGEPCGRCLRLPGRAGLGSFLSMPRSSGGRGQGGAGRPPPRGAGGASRICARIGRNAGKWGRREGRTVSGRGRIPAERGGGCGDRGGRGGNPEPGCGER